MTADIYRCHYCTKERHVSVMRPYYGVWLCKRKCWRRRKAVYELVKRGLRLKWGVLT